MKNPAAALFFAVLLTALAFALISSLPVASEQDRTGVSPQVCQSGAQRSCVSGSCSGVSTCTDGVWSGCRWSTICAPGTREPCFHGACSYAVRECDACGTAYGECFAP